MISFRKIWKKLSYIKKSGIIGGVTGFFYIVLIFLMGGLGIEFSGIIERIFLIFLLPLMNLDRFICDRDFILSFSTDFLCENILPLAVFGAVIYIILGYFMGMFIGHIIQNIRNKFRSMTKKTKKTLSNKILIILIPLLLSFLTMVILFCILWGIEGLEGLLFIFISPYTIITWFIGMLVTERIFRTKKVYLHFISLPIFLFITSGWYFYVLEVMDKEPLGFVFLSVFIFLSINFTIFYWIFLYLTYPIKDRSLKKVRKIYLSIVVFVVLVVIALSLIHTYLVPVYDNYWTKKAIDEENLGYCDKIITVENEQLCYYEIAKLTRNIDICDNLPSPQPRIGADKVYFQIYYQIFDMYVIKQSKGVNRYICRRDVEKTITNFALETKNYEDCKENEECIYQLALKLNDSDKCARFEDDKKNSCFLIIAKTTENLGLCKEIKNTKKEECYYFFYSLLLDPELCFNVGSKNVTCFYNYSISAKDISYCKYTLDKKDECIFGVATNKSEVTYCADTGKFKADCYYHFAQKDNNLDFCELSEQFKTQCYFEFAISQKNPSLCLKSGEHKDRCYFRLANDLKNPQLCFNIDPTKEGCLDNNAGYPLLGYCRFIEDSISNCIYQSSVLSLNANHCSDIKKEQQVGRCYSDIAVLLLDGNLCESAGDFKENCYYEIAIKKKDRKMCKLAGPWMAKCLEATNT